MEYLQFGIVDVHNPASEVVPYISQASRRQGLPPGFQLLEETMPTLSASEVSLLVLPPLKGMKPESIATLRRLHQEGVSLLCCCDVTGMEDIFGVKDSGEKKTVTRICGTDGFLTGETEYCDDERCAGRYVATDAKILLASEKIPLLTVKSNEKAFAAFFNAAPHLVREDCLHERLSYGKEGISDFMERAVGDILRRLSPPPLSVNGGRLVACRTQQGKLLVMVYNPSELHGREVELALTSELASAFPVLEAASQTVVRPESSRMLLSLPPFGHAWLVLANRVLASLE